VHKKRSEFRPSEFLDSLENPEDKSYSYASAKKVDENDSNAGFDYFNDNRGSTEE
jgi:hypothetical protein